MAAKICPLMKEECKESKCMFWVKTNEKNATCAVAAIPMFLKEMWLKQPARFGA